MSHWCHQVGTLSVRRAHQARRDPRSRAHRLFAKVELGLRGLPNGFPGPLVDRD